MPDKIMSLPQSQLTSEQRRELQKKSAVTRPEVPDIPMTMRIDLHCHSEASPDCSTPIEEIPDRCVESGIRIQAITDHDVIWGAQKMKTSIEKRDDLDLTLIVGEEISTNQGELVGLFLKEAVEPGLSPEETIAAVQEQGGLVLLPHGFDPLRIWRLKPAVRDRLVDGIDIVETFNARISRPNWNRAAAEWSQKHGLLKSAGSDAHTLADIGSAWVEVPVRDVNSPSDLMTALKDGIPVGNWTHPLLAYFYKLWDRTRRRINKLLHMDESAG
jgi:predicted metal-dependent phosphoesterase TrpH